MKKLCAIIISLVLIFGASASSVSALTLSQQLSGRIVLQVQSNGEAWYIYPKELTRYYLGRPDDAYSIMRTRGLGITNTDLAKIPVQGTNTTGDLALQKKLSGYIVLQVQSHGEAWYVYPVNLKRYYLGRPDDAFSLMRTLGLGISNSNLKLIPLSSNSLNPNNTVSTPAPADFTLNDGHDTDREKILDALNTERTANGLKSLSISTQATNGAQAQANDMSTYGYYSLTSPSGKKTSDWIKEAGYDAQSLSIHIDTFQGSSSDLLARWKSRSPSQYQESALSVDYRDIGIGVTTVNSMPVYVVIIGLSSADYFTQQTAGLSNLTQIRNDMLIRVNAERAKAGVGPLKMNDKLQLAAQRHTDDMLARSFYDHVNPDGLTPDQRVAAAGYDFQMTGENIAKGQTTVQKVMDDWMASAGHRENILNPSYTEVGFGLSFGKNADGYAVLWAQEFGKPF